MGVLIVCCVYQKGLTFEYLLTFPRSLIGLYSLGDTAPDPMSTSKPKC